MYESHEITIILTNCAFVWFLSLILFQFICNNITLSVVVLTVYWFFCSLYVSLDLLLIDGYEKEKEALILFDGAAILILTSILAIDNKAKFHTLILCFAVLCHSMILLSLKLQQETFFYIWYDEMISISCLLHIMVTFDDMAKGINCTLRRVQSFLSRHFIYHNCDNQNLPKRKKRKA